MPFLKFDEAVELFYQIADCESLHHHNPQICQARSLKVADMIHEKSGIQPRKICAFARHDKPLMVDDNPIVAAAGGWKFHVVPLVPVMWENGDIHEMAFDPTLFDAPVSVNQWRKHIRAEHNSLAKGGLKEGLSPAHNGFMSLTVEFKSPRARQSLYSNFHRAEKGKRVVSLSKAANKYFQRNKAIKRRSFGKSWTTAKSIKQAKK